MTATDMETPFTSIANRFREFENETFTETAANALIEEDAELTDDELDMAFDTVSTATNYGQTATEGRILARDFQRIASRNEEE